MKLLNGEKIIGYFLLFRVFSFGSIVFLGYFLFRVFSSLQGIFKGIFVFYFWVFSSFKGIFFFNNRRVFPSFSRTLWDFFFWGGRGFDLGKEGPVPRPAFRICKHPNQTVISSCSSGCLLTVYLSSLALLVNFFFFLFPDTLMHFFLSPSIFFRICFFFFFRGEAGICLTGLHRVYKSGRKTSGNSQTAPNISAETFRTLITVLFFYLHIR